MIRSLVVAAFLSSTSSIFCQSLAVKSGLWENRSVDDDGSVTRARECMSPEQFRQQLSKLQERPGCKVTSAVSTSTHTVMEVSCQIKSSTVKVHAELTAIDSEHVTAVITSVVTLNGKPQTSSIKSEAHFVSASCGNVKPGDPEIIE